MTTLLHQPNLTEGLTLLGWKLRRDAVIRGKDFPLKSFRIPFVF